MGNYACKMEQNNLDKKRNTNPYLTKIDEMCRFIPSASIGTYTFLNKTS